MNGLSIVANLLSAGIFLGASGFGIAAVAASEVGVAASAARVAAQSGAQSLAREAQPLTQLQAAQMAKFQGQIASAEKLSTQASDGTRFTNAMGAGLWTTAALFSVISAFTDPEVSPL